MRDWYKKYRNEKGEVRRGRSPYFWVIGINILLVFYFLTDRSKTEQNPYPLILSKKLTSNVAKNNVMDSSYIERDKISYIVEYSCTNNAYDGDVIIEAVLEREDTTLYVSKIEFIKGGDTLHGKLDFPEIDYKDLKRSYELQVGIPVK